MAITLLGQTIMLWTLSSTGWNAILPLASWICSGMVVPLPYLPDAARAVLELLPFAGLIDTPVPYLLRTRRRPGGSAGAADAGSVGRLSGGGRTPADGCRDPQGGDPGWMIQEWMIQEWMIQGGISE